MAERVDRARRACQTLAYIIRPASRNWRYLASTMRASILPLIGAFIVASGALGASVMKQGTLLEKRVSTPYSHRHLRPSRCQLHVLVMSSWRRGRLFHQLLLLDGLGMFVLWRGLQRK
jgi:hypothetical protein